MKKKIKRHGIPHMLPNNYRARERDFSAYQLCVIVFSPIYFAKRQNIDIYYNDR